MYHDVVGNFGSVSSLFCSNFSYHKGKRLCTAFQTMCLPSCFLLLRSYGDYLNLNLPDALILCWQSSTDVSPSATPSSTPLVGTHAPKFGTVIPSRIFVGGIAANVSIAVTLFICTMTMSRNVDNLDSFRLLLGIVDFFCFLAHSQVKNLINWTGPANFHVAPVLQPKQAVLELLIHTF